MGETALRAAAQARETATRRLRLRGAEGRDEQSDAGQALDGGHPLDGAEHEGDSGEQEENAGETIELLLRHAAGQAAHSTMLTDSA
jgi:hypothetical protein